MENPAPLGFSLDMEQAEAFCAALWRQSSSPAHTLAALTALESFLLATVRPAQRSAPEFAAIAALLQRRAAQARAQLLADTGVELQAAMAERSLASVARLHRSLSRSGFGQAAQNAAQNIGPDALCSAAAWTSAWCRDAKARALAASGYPDALDFKGAGILPAEYAAMSDLGACLAGKKDVA
ncbi:MAG: hypothetical protein K8F27_13385 [Sulfuricellaceae bacterium]|nr:hypothetical protein [Sulfuricellaceae bacterium]